MKKFALLLLLITFFSCGKKGPEKPERLLSEEQMENILYDLTIMQTISSTNSQQLQQNDIDIQRYIYNKYNIDSLTLVQNQKYYANNIEKFQAMHNKVTERLKAEKAPLDSIKATPENKSRKLDKLGVTP